MAENNGTPIPGEQDGSSLSPQKQEASYEEKASSKGWKPLEEFDGDQSDWVPAKEFLDREPLYREIRELKRTMRKQAESFQKDMAVISQQFSQMSEAAQKKALAELKAERRAAIVDQDLERIETLDEQIEAVQLAPKAAPVKPQAESATLIAWKEDNPWFDKDAELRAEAVQIGVGYIAAHNGRKSEDEVLAYVTDRVKKIFPEKFATTRTKESVDSKVETNGGTNRPNIGGKKSKLSISDLSDEERRVMNTFIKRGALKAAAEKNKRSEQDEYIAQLATAKGL